MSWIIALQSPLPVIVRNVAPEVVKSLSLPAVRISNWPRPDPLALWTLAAAVGAFIVGLVTLLSTLRQLSIARQELRAVNIDLENSSKQVAELMRKPSISVKMTAKACPLPANTSESAAAIDNAKLKAAGVRFVASIFNTGNKIARSPMIELLFNVNIFDEDVSVDRKVGNTNYVVRRALWNNEVIYPNGEPMEKAFETLVSARNAVTRTTILWRAYDEFDAYPASDYGSAHVAWE